MKSTENYKIVTNSHRRKVLLIHCLSQNSFMSFVGITMLFQKILIGNLGGYKIISEMCVPVNLPFIIGCKLLFQLINLNLVQNMLCGVTSLRWVSVKGYHQISKHRIIHIVTCTKSAVKGRNEMSDNSKDIQELVTKFISLLYTET